MNPKVILILVVLCGALAAGVWLVPSNRPTTTPAEAEGLKPGAEVFAGFRTADAKAVTLRKGERRIRLEKNPEGKWVLASHQNRKANADRLDRLLEGFQKATLAKKREGALEKFDLDETHRTELEVLSAGGNFLAKLYVGKSPEWGKCFAQTPGQDAILELSQNFEDLGQVITEKDERVLSVDNWYDLKVLRLAADDVIDVAVKKDHETWRVQKVIPGQGPVTPVTPGAKKEGEKKEGEKKEEPKPVWWVTEPEGGEADESACSGIASGAAWLDAKGYADDLKPEERGLDKPTAKTRLVLKDGTAYTLIFGKVGDNYAVMQIQGQPEVWKIEKYNYETFTKPLEKLRKETKSEKAEPPAKAEAPAPSPGAEKPAPATKDVPPEVPPIPDQVKEAPQVIPPAAAPKIEAPKAEPPKIEAPKATK